MNSHDPDFPQATPALSDAETAPPEATVPAEAEAGVAAPGLEASSPESAIPETIPDAVPEVISEPIPEVISEPIPEVISEALPEASEPEQPTPERPIQAEEVWTELDEAKPAVASWSEVDKGGEPDPSGLDAGSGMRREAEKPGRPSLPYDDWEPSEVPYQPKELGIIDQVMIVLAEGAALWRKVLRQVRSWLPRPWQRNLSDELMTALALGLLIFGLVLWNPLGGREAASRVAVEEPTRPDPAMTQGRDLAGNGGGLPERRDAAPESSEEALEPSPEQRLIADIQDRVSTISRSYAVGLIQSVEVNLPQQRIAINVGNDWYGLGEASQDRIAQDIYAQAQGLAFATLQLRDSDGVVVARSPVVGPSMVILKRHRPGDPLG